MISKRLRGLTPYTPGEQPRDRSYVKLNTNENPYPPDPEVREYFRSFDVERLRLYPDPLFTDLREALSHRYGLPPEWIFAGNGSDEVLSFAFYAFFDSRLLMSEHSYSFYPVYCDFYGINFIRIPSAEGLTVDLDGFLNEPSPGGAVIANPNSPTGTYIGLDNIRRFMSRFPNDRLVLLDEAYIEFGGESALPLVEHYDNLLVVRTLSKGTSLAGLRLGYAFGQPELIRSLFTVKDSFNSYPLNTVSQDVAAIAIRNSGYYEGVRRRVMQTRERCSSELLAAGWNVLPSKANFIFAAHPTLPGELVYERLRGQGILVRHFSAPALSRYVRITIGTDEEIDTLLEEYPRCRLTGRK